MRKFSLAARPGIAGILFILALGTVAMLALAGCGGNEAEQRKAFAALLQDNILNKQGVAIKPLSPAEEKAIGGYTEHYAVLESFQKGMAGETAKNARNLIALAGMDSLAAMAKAESSLRKATNDAKKLRNSIESMEKKADKAKAGLKTPEDLAPAYDAAYEKIVTGPAAAGKAAFDAVHDVFSATLGLLDFINTNGRDMEIAGTTINVKNPALLDELHARMAVVKEKSAELRNAYAAMTKALL